MQRKEKYNALDDIQIYEARRHTDALQCITRSHIQAAAAKPEKHESTNLEQLTLSKTYPSKVTGYGRRLNMQGG